MRLGFGKFKGEPLSSVPLSYVAWLLEQPWIDDDLRAQVKIELASHIGASDRDVKALAGPVDDETLEAMQALVRTGFRTEAQRVHPDRGGSHKAMIALTRARAWLDTVITEVAA